VTGSTAATLTGVTYLLDHPTYPPLDEATARAHAAELRELAAAHGVSNLRFVSTGHLLGHIEPGYEVGEDADFEIEAEERLRRSFFLITDGALRNPGVSPELLNATPL
jgi:hypothetical protein